MGESSLRVYPIVRLTLAFDPGASSDVAMTERSVVSRTEWRSLVAIAGMRLKVKVKRKKIFN